MAWLFVGILAYLFLSLSSLGDKLVLKGATKAISYTFFAGAMNLLAIFLLPFFEMNLPELTIFCWLIVDAIVFLFGLYLGFLSIDEFEVSKASATIGATQPVFVFFISWFFFGYQAMSLANFFAFLLLFLGSIFISFEKKPKLTGRFLKLTILSAMMYSLDYVLIKYIYANMGFTSGFMSRVILISLFAVCLLIFPKNRKEIFKQEKRTGAKLKKTFLATQACGGLANILQSYAVYLAPVAVLPILNSMRGIQYIFLLVITSAMSYFFPKILKENISRKKIAQKATGIILIVVGLVVLVF